MEDSFTEVAFDATMEFNIYLIENGILQLEVPNMYDRWTSLPITNYCVDYCILEESELIKPCYWVQLSAANNVQNNIYLTSATLVSCFFLLLVLVVYFLLPELQNLCGLILMAYVFSLLMAFLLLFVIQIMIHNTVTCIGLTMSIYFFFLAS
ncbi:hypothetical protein PYW08_004644 [Mythimna loreyi]|uniref:Uncharacterized protein n=1 Tax=Mythimna loreyi TaxID=667449 RepID=A0ACC2QRF8_9NEOP|nr:hypothetical protein PYW08_004644 [Mythimna loreyi]